MVYIMLTFLLITFWVKLSLLFLVENRSVTFSISENDRLQVHVITGEVLKILRETLMLLKPINEIHFNVLDILSIY